MGEVQMGVGMSGGMDQTQTEAAFVGVDKWLRQGRAVATAMDMGNER